MFEFRSSWIRVAAACLVLAGCATVTDSDGTGSVNTETSPVLSGTAYKPTIVGSWQTLFAPLEFQPPPAVPLYMNDHTVFKGTDGKWHVYGISGIPNANTPWFKGPETSFAAGVSTTLLGAYTETSVVGPYYSNGQPRRAWAPHAVIAGGTTYLFYESSYRDTSSGQDVGILGLLTTTDYQTWTQRLDVSIDHWPSNAARDPMVLQVGAQYYMYYTDLYDGRSAVSYATSSDLIHWTYRGVVWTSSGDATNIDYSAAESPFIVHVGSYYYLSITLTDGGTSTYHQTLIFRSSDPTSFGDFNGSKGNPAGTNLVAELPVHAPEFIQDPDTGKWYITTGGWIGFSIYPEAHNGVAIAEFQWQQAPAKPTVPDAVPSSGLQTWFKFDNDGPNPAVDSSGNGRDGTMYLRSLPVETGRYNGGLFFNRTYGGLINLAPQSFAGDFSVGAWVNMPETPTNWDAIVGGNQQDINFYQSKARLNANGVDVVVASSPIQPGTWTHVLITRSSGNLKLYLNGVLDATGTWSGVFAPTTVAKGVTPFYLHGTLDDLVLYNRALTPAEALQLAHGTTYYVDSTSTGNDANDGLSPTTAWKTVGYVSSRTFAAGDTILFKAGDGWPATGEASPMQLHPRGSGSSGNPIKIDMYGTGNKPRIAGAGAGAGSGSATPQAAVYLRDQSGWEIRDLDVTNHGPAGSEYVGIKVENTQPILLRHIYIGNNTIHDVNGIVNGFYASNAGIAVTADMDTSNPCPNWPNACPPNPTWDDVTIENNTIDSVDRIGIYVGFNYQAPNADAHGWTLFQRITNVTIRGNTLSHLGGDGVLTVVAQNVLMEHNVVSNSGTKIIADGVCGGACSSNNTGFAVCNSVAMWTAVTDSSVIQYNEVFNYGLPGAGGAIQCDGTAFDTDQGTTNQLIQYNYSHNNEGGMLLTCEVDGPGGALAITNQQVRYNVSYNDVRGAFQYTCGLGTFPAGAQPARINNNTVVTSGVTNSLFITNGGSLPGTASVFDNIFYVRNGSTAYPTIGSSVFSYNVYFGTQSSRPFDSHGLTSDPKLVQPAAAAFGLTSVDGMKLAAGSPALLSGTNASTSNLGPLDFWGNSVPGSPSAVNRGAYNGSGLALGPVNVALGATATLSPNTSYEGEGWGASKVTDGRRDSVYSVSEGITTQAYGTPNTTVDLIIQLPSVKTFSSVVLYPRNDDGWALQGFPVNFTIDVWNGSTYLTRVTKTGYAPTGNTGQTFTWFSDTTDRIRIHATTLGSVPGYGYYLELAEVEVY